MNNINMSNNSFKLNDRVKVRDYFHKELINKIGRVVSSRNSHVIVSFDSPIGTITWSDPRANLFNVRIFYRTELKDLELIKNNFYKIV